jgi:hypothetical protein
MQVRIQYNKNVQNTHPHLALTRHRSAISKGRSRWRSRFGSMAPAEEDDVEMVPRRTKSLIKRRSTLRQTNSEELSNVDVTNVSSTSLERPRCMFILYWMDGWIIYPHCSCVIHKCRCITY